MPRYQIDYCQPVLARYRAFVTAADPLQAVRLVCDGAVEDYDESVQEVEWNAMLPIRLEDIYEVREEEPAFEVPAEIITEVREKVRHGLQGKQARDYGEDGPCSASS